jgi:superfamily II DNA helicase RecQ
MKYVLAIVIDEAHCISDWGGDFRKSFGKLDKLRSYVAANVPFYATSATLPPHTLGQVVKSLSFSRQQTFFLNLGNDNTSITYLVCRMKGAKRDLEALDFLVDEPLTRIPGPMPFIRTIVFFESRLLVYKGARHLRALLPNSLRSRVDFLTAGRCKSSKTRVMEQFRSGEVDILCATEAAGMVRRSRSYFLFGFTHYLSTGPRHQRC